MLEQQQQGGRWKLAGQVLNLIQDARLESPTGVYGPGNPENTFAISGNGVPFAATDLTATRPEEIGFSKPFYVSVDDFTHGPQGLPQESSLPSDIGVGHTWNVKFTPDESSIAFIYYPANQTCGSRLFLASVGSLRAHDIVKRVGSAFDNDSFNPPLAFEFSGDSGTVIFQSEKRGRTILSSLKLQDGETPKVLSHSGSVSSSRPLEVANWNELLVCTSSLVDSSIWQALSGVGWQRSENHLLCQRRQGRAFRFATTHGG